MWRTQRRYHPDGSSYAWLVKTSALVNFFYFYCVDADFGPFFIKFCAYFPYTAKLCINGHEWAKRQAARAGIGFEALDNGFASCRTPARCRPSATGSARPTSAPCWISGCASCRTRSLLMTSPLATATSCPSCRPSSPHPGPGRTGRRADLLRAGHPGQSRHRPPEQVALVFARRLVRKGRFATPGRFRTRVITNGVVPSLHIDYKHTKIKQYHKLGRALRTETTINDAPADFGIPKRLTSLPALRQIGFAANRRLLGVQTVSHNPIRGARAFTA